MVDRGVLLARLAAGVATTPPDRPLVLRLCESCTRLLDADGAAVTLGYPTNLRVTLCTTSPTAERLEDLQEVLGEGPSRDAYTGNHPVSAQLPEPAGRWPMLGESLRRQTLELAVLATPMRSASTPFGVLTLHRRAPFSAEEQDTAQFVADALGAAVAHEEHEQDAGTTEPWQRRSRVHQATGMVIAQLRLGPEDALAMIRAHAFAHDTTVYQVADEIVGRRLRLGAPPEGDTQP
jgi:GAF domain-containing protein